MKKGGNWKKQEIRKKVGNQKIKEIKKSRK